MNTVGRHTEDKNTKDTNTSESMLFGHEQLHAMQQKLILFIRYLSSEGFSIDVESHVIAQQLLATNNFSNRSHFQHSLRTVLCKDAQQWRKFNQLYIDFWLRKPKIAHVKQSPKPTKNTMKSDLGGDDNHGKNQHAQPQKTPSHGTDSASNADTASAKETIESMDFAFLDNSHLLPQFTHSCRELAKLLSRKLRKTTPSSKHERIDLRQTIQRNLKHGGNLIELVWLTKPKIRPHFTLLVDVSRSMSGYSDAFLTFALAIIRELPETRVFIFNTQLIDISAALRSNRLEKIKQQLQLLNNTWGGGTRIAHSLAELRKRGLPKNRANHHVIIHSDGLDTDPPSALKHQLMAMQKHYRRILWLSPLLRDASYRVETAALKAALPHIDALLPVHNVMCLSELAQRMSKHTPHNHANTRQATYAK